MRPQLTVIVDLDSLLGHPQGVGGEVGWAGPLDPEACRRLACDGAVTRVLVTRQPNYHPGRPDPGPGTNASPEAPDSSGNNRLEGRLRAATQTVLVVDDEKELREVARRLLQRQGYTVLVAANADEALRLFEHNGSIEVLLTDVVMPGASGPELTRQLVERHPALKVIYMSGYTEDAIVKHGVLNPGVALLHKPFTSETLGRKVREALDR